MPETTESPKKKTTHKSKTRTITKADIVSSAWDKLPLSKNEVYLVVEEFFEIFKHSLLSEGKVLLSGFGSFETYLSPSRLGRNPATGEPMQLPARMAVRFKPSEGLVEEIDIAYKATKNNSD